MPFFRWWELCVAIVISRLAAETFISLSVNLRSAWCEGGGLRFERSEHGGLDSCTLVNIAAHGLVPEGGALGEDTGLTASVVLAEREIVNAYIAMKSAWWP
jgi:hypothetical protein